MLQRAKGFSVRWKKRDLGCHRGVIKGLNILDDFNELNLEPVEPLNF